MLLAAVIHYFAGGYSAIDLPFPIIPAVAVYLSSLLFLGGLGLTLYGFYLRIRE
jgi:ABC-type thiamin/hydroxymethylpyrimidine transport system permease subunit